MMMYCFTLEWVRIAHFGDVGNRLTEGQLPQMADAEVVIVPMGGPPTIELDDLYDALQSIQPQVTIPMHHQLSNRKFPQMLSVTAFTDRFPEDAVVWINEPEVELTRASLPSDPRIMVLKATATQ